MSDLPEIDPALAHLYADVDGFDDEGEPIEVPHREISIDDLTEHEAGPEVFSDHDVTELALLVEEAQRTKISSDLFLAELGLGEFRTIKGEQVDPDDGFDEEVFFDLNALGVAVTRRIAERAGLLPTHLGPFDRIAPGAFGTEPQTVPLTDRPGGKVIGSATVNPDGTFEARLDG